MAQDVAAFLLMRGPHAWIGWGPWGMLWPTTPDGSGLARPAVMTAEYGEPVDGALCSQTGPTTFSRAYSLATVTLDCRTWEATFVPASAGNSESH